MEPNLPNREREILRAVVDSYIQTGEPVGSRTISREHPESRSPATIRNVMSDLEEAGLLSQPHPSAGRLPTERGIRFYVEELLEPHPVPDEERARIDHALRSSPRGELGVLLERASQVLAELSHNVGMVLVPAFSTRVFERIDFVRIAPHRVAVLFMSRPGLVDHRVVQVDEDHPQAELDRVSRYLNDSFRGLSLPEIRAQLLEMMSEDKAQYDRLMREAIELSTRSFDPAGAESDLIVEGKTNILDTQGFDSVERMKSLFHAFEEKSRLVALLNQCLDDKGRRLFIGSEAGTAGIPGCSLIVSPYHDGTRPVGTVGVLGPERMEYARVISLVDTLARLLSDLLSEGQWPQARSAQGGTR